MVRVLVFQGFVWILLVSPVLARAAEHEELARQFMRCSFVLAKIAESLPDKAQAERAQSASAMFTLIGAKNAAGEAFVTSEIAGAADAYARELKDLRDKDQSSQAMSAFLSAQNAMCAKLFSEHRTRYFAR